MDGVLSVSGIQKSNRLVGLVVKASASRAESETLIPVTTGFFLAESYQ